MKQTPEQIKQIIADKVIGQITPEHTGDGHFYRFPSGILQSSVTGKLQLLSKPHLTRWAIRKGIEWLEVDDRWRFLGVNTMRDSYIKGAVEAHTEIRDQAGSIGTVAHDVVEQYIKQWLSDGVRPASIMDFFPTIDGKLVADLRSVACARGMEQLFMKHDVIPLASEILVGDEKVSAGTLDFLCLWHGALCLIDLKTSNAVDPIGYSLQVSAYKGFFQKMTGLSIKKCKIIHLSKDSDKFDVYNVIFPGKTYKVFKKLCEVWKWVNDGNKKVEKDIKRAKLI